MVIRKKAPTAKEAKSSTAVNQAIRAGARVPSPVASSLLYAYTVWVGKACASCLPRHNASSPTKAWDSCSWLPALQPGESLGQLFGVKTAVRCCTQSRLPLGKASAGAQVETLKKFDAGSNKHGAGPIKHAAKLEQETEVFEHEHVSTELKKQIQQARIAKKLTQAQVRGVPFWRRLAGG